MPKFPRKCAVPIVLLVHNRPEHTRQVLERIREAQPQQLFVVADGPRPGTPSDQGACAEVREIVDRTVDWDAEVFKNYASHNLGLRDRVASGLTWVFERVDRAIVLEDDCVPDPSFFRFCEELLDHYTGDPNVGVITGNNFQQPPFACETSYYFSKFNHCWGWATWSRAWRLYDHRMRQWPELKRGGWLNGFFAEPQDVQHWAGIFDQVYEGRFNSWAYAWTFACWSHHLLTATPKQNLVTNIGFGPGGTHCLNPECHLANLPVSGIEFPLRHPPATAVNEEADRHVQMTVFKGIPVQAAAEMNPEKPLMGSPPRAALRPKRRWFPFRFSLLRRRDKDRNSLSEAGLQESSGK